MNSATVVVNPVGGFSDPAQIEMRSGLLDVRQNKLAPQVAQNPYSTSGADRNQVSDVSLWKSMLSGAAAVAAM